MKEKLASPTAIVASRKARGTALPVIPAASEPLRAIAAGGAMMPMESAIASKKESSRRSLPSCFSIGQLLLRILRKERLLSYKCLQSETITVVFLRMMCSLPLLSQEYLANCLV